MADGRKIRWVFTGGLVLLLVALFSSAWKASKIWPEGQKPIKVEQAPGDPAAYALFEAAAKAGEGIDKTTLDANKLLEAEALPQVLPTEGWADNAKALEALAAMKPVPGLGLAPTKLTGKGPRFFGLVALSTAQQERVLQLVSQNQVDRAAGELAHLHALGRALILADAGMLGVLVGSQVELDTLNLVERLLRRGGPAAVAIRSAFPLTAVQDPKPIAFVRGLASEARILEDMIRDMAARPAMELFDDASLEGQGEPSEGIKAPKWMFDAEASVQLVRKRTRAMIDAAEQPAASRRWPKFEPLWKREGLSLGKYLNNPIGRILLDVAQTSFEDYIRGSDALQALRARVRTRLSAN